MTNSRVAVVGAGMAGIACARALRDSGIDVVVLDRGHRIGGRMASRTMRDTGLPYDGRVVDVGASYLTAAHPAFATVVEGWAVRGLIREWTDSFALVDVDGTRTTAPGPMRYAAPHGLRSLVEDLSADLPQVVNPHEVEQVTRTQSGATVDGDEFDAVVLAMPAPQACDVLAGDDIARAHLDRHRWDPVLSLVAAYDTRCWPAFDAMFVNDSAALTFVADDGSRRGDGAPVLVAHSGAIIAAHHLDDPARAIPVLLAELSRAVGATEEPSWVDVRRWSLARPHTTNPEPCYLDGTLGLCGDAWGQPARIETAWVSGDTLGRRMAAHLAGRSSP